MMKHPEFHLLVAPERNEAVIAWERVVLFLAGSIDMGKAVEWQTQVVEALKDLPITVCNPRRADFDASLVQDISNPDFVTQVNWELDHIEEASLVIFYFDPAGQAPVTMAELGVAVARGSRCIVCCPPGFWRRGNVQVMCKRWHVPLVDDLDSLLHLTRAAVADMLSNAD